MKNEEDIAFYLEVCLEENDPRLLAAALGDIARVREMAQLAHDTGLAREGLYKALSVDGSLSLATIMTALGARLHAEIAPAHAR
ncbi:putative addiction module antidote protein [Pseudomonas capeferrum]|uniref:addiction module antidote protein n=1 Tax=Pseudomonas capeferrum TaxID=1495066 RepID=UPI0015E439C3|nr:addiction module antidote protein [Pseudomonas capeferrum]MBA1204611.1 putative addiction module antidote protein [Pseudomonas capeferrum]